MTSRWGVDITLASQSLSFNDLPRPLGFTSEKQLVSLYLYYSMRD